MRSLLWLETSECCYNLVFLLFFLFFSFHFCTLSLCSPVPDLDAGKVRRVVPWKSFHGIWYIMFGKSHRFQHTPTSMFAALEVNKNKKVLVGSWY